MGAIAEAIVAYAQPLLDETNGSEEDLNKALSISQLCFNLALLPEEKREEFISDMRSTLEMDDDEFDAFRRTVVAPMIRRHEEMFPVMHRRHSTGPSRFDLSPLAQPAARAEKYPGTGRYDPCPCNSGKKYKFCCGQKGR
ncbi:MAG TPA: SEC-C metal-binding domain-containing protein [Pirellulales bacterium]|nr:SEC-C metal-binding domain-containing protein [Pirellulales bacterium]